MARSFSSSEGRNRWLAGVSSNGNLHRWTTPHKVGEQRMASGGPGTAIPVDNDEPVVRRGDLAGDRRPIPERGGER